MLATLMLCLVVAVADGDTLTARCGTPGAYEQVKVRIAAIDAPEKRQAFGKRAGQNLAALCFRQTARITPRSRDRYGRTVADVECQSKDVAETQVRDGFAWVYPQYARGYERLYEVQAGAEEAKRGLWADPDPVPPWAWRRTKRAR